MERQEPTLGQPIEPAELQFRRPRNSTYYRRESSGIDISWKIAVGIFIGLTAFSLVTCTAIGVAGDAALKEQERREQAAMAELAKAMSDPDPMGIRQREIERQRQEAAFYALRPGERCIDGKRFRRLENGWEQVNRPCR